MFFSKFKRYYSRVVKKDLFTATQQKSFAVKGQLHLSTDKFNKNELGIAWVGIEFVAGRAPSARFSRKDISQLGIRKKQIVSFITPFSFGNLLLFLENNFTSYILNANSGYTLVQKSEHSSLANSLWCFPCTSHYTLENESVFFKTLAKKSFYFDLLGLSTHSISSSFFLSSFQINFANDSV